MANKSGLEGRTIVRTEAMSQQMQLSLFGCHKEDSPPAVLVLDNGDEIFASSDSEMNSPGSINLLGKDLEVSTLVVKEKFDTVRTKQ